MKQILKTAIFTLAFSAALCLGASAMSLGGGTVTATALNLRTEPSMTSRILLQIPRGAQVRVYGQTGDWSIVEYNGVTGYARSEFIR